MERNRLSRPVYWQGRQWAVTGYGLETVSEPYHYFFEKARLGSLDEGDREEPEFSSLRHIMSKTWCDVDDLAEAFRQAIAFHPEHFSKLPPDWKASIERTLARARRSKVRAGNIERFLPDDEILRASDYEAAERKAREAGELT